MGPKYITMAEYDEMAESNMGFCRNCKEFTRDNTEPDAMHYDCPLCGKGSVYGIEEAMFAGLIEVSELDAI